jgi:hypothetical protein
LPRPCSRAREAARSALPRAGPVFVSVVYGWTLKEMVAAAVAFQGAVCVCVPIDFEILGDFFVFDRGRVNNGNTMGKNWNFWGIKMKV